MTLPALLEKLEVREVRYPFIWDLHTEFDENGPYEALGWRPGLRGILVPPDSGEEICDAYGVQVLTVVSRHKPGKRYPERVFYTQQFITPDGHRFGRGGLRMLTAAAFERRARGFRVEHRLATPEETESHLAALKARNQ